MIRLLLLVFLSCWSHPAVKASSALHPTVNISHCPDRDGYLFSRLSICQLHGSPFTAISRSRPKANCRPQHSCESWLDVHSYIFGRHSARHHRQRLLRSAVIGIADPLSSFCPVFAEGRHLAGAAKTGASGFSFPGPIPAMILHMRMKKVSSRRFESSKTVEFYAQTHIRTVNKRRIGRC